MHRVMQRRIVYMNDGMDYINAFIESTFERAINLQTIIIEARLRPSEEPAPDPPPPLDDISPVVDYATVTTPFFQPTCSICLEAYTPNSRVRCLPCNHVFHAECIDKWVTKKAECALCKKEL
jgi:hypothetical protein